MTATNSSIPSVVITVQDNDHADIKGLIKSVSEVVEAYRKFYGNNVKKAATDARKSLQTVRAQAAAMRKQIHADRMAKKEEQKS